MFLSQIYCHGPFLDHIQKLELSQVEESKYFVDMKLKQPEIDILNAFDQLTDDEKNDRDYMSDWLDIYFDRPGSEFENHQFDQVEHPKMLDKIQNDDYRQWALDLHKIWQQERFQSSKIVVLSRSMDCCAIVCTKSIGLDNFYPTLLPDNSLVEIQVLMLN